MICRRTPFFKRHLAYGLPLLALCALGTLQSAAQSRDTRDPKAIVSAAVQTELASDRNDHSAYMYRDHDVTPDHDTLFYVIETPEGLLKRKLEDHGRALNPADRHIDDLRIHALLNDTNAQQRSRKDSAHDDQQAEEMLKLLPTAYLWTVENQSGDLITLNFKPDPAFEPASLEARVLSAMAGQVIVARGDNRIRTIRGALVDDVKFGYGIFGRLRKGGTFQVERREVVPHHWQVVESHVHIVGHALFFKTIGSEEDETRSEFKPSPALTLQQAYAILEPKR
jgi:hypothetical protein